MASPETPSNDKAQIIEEENNNKMDDKTAKILTACVLIANLIAVVSLVLAFVGVARNSSNEYYITTSGSSSSGDEETQTVKGYNVDVVNAVCQLAGKNCVLVWDVYENCWTSVPGQRSRGGVGLMARWYDACVGWTNTYDRARTLSFSDDFEKPVDLALWVKPGGTIPNWPSLANAKLGFLDGWLTDQHCLNQYSDIFSVNGAFISVRPWNNDHPEFELFWQAPENRCVRGGLGMMVQKDQFELLTWWNAAFQRLTATSQYEDICQRLETAHGDLPGLSAEYVCV
ncbi:hypothetical protein HOLleu_27463 [Holothuria leucospilota]|uniref:Solute-binding protein family 3/N-terminal domain-containing protein n=1 Tax=Holothuria leucospilota TaxID=206669 RepID=A0A9Q1H3I4_HOLLE|nr:hypothetical protein HOLleu_27463 [Holothuria leucospilota]